MEKKELNDLLESREYRILYNNKNERYSSLYGIEVLRDGTFIPKSEITKEEFKLLRADEDEVVMCEHCGDYDLIKKGRFIRNGPEEDKFVFLCKECLQSQTSICNYCKHKIYDHMEHNCFTEHKIKIYL